MTTIGRPWDPGATVVLYGAAPFPESPRNPWDEVEPIVPFEPLQPFKPADVKPALPAPAGKLPAHHQFTWGGVTFIWSNGNRFFGQALLEHGWRANVYPDGTHWLAEIEIGGGKHTGNGETPAVALNAARLAWQKAVGALGIGDDEPKGAPFEP
jgi:hypothetical protein